MSKFVVSKRDLCVYFINNGTSSESILKFLEDNYNLSPTNRQKVMEEIQQNLLGKFKDRWTKAQRKASRFLETNATWLDADFEVQLNDETPETSGGRGRPSKPYEDLSDKTKKRKNMELIQEYGFDFVHNAYVQELRSRGDPEEASIVSTLRTLNRDDKKTIKQQLLHEVETVSSYSINEALSIYIDLNLTKSQYGYLRTCLIQKKCSVFPSYPSLKNAKMLCYPSASSIVISDIGAQVKLQDLLDHTVARILLIDTANKPDLQNLKLFSKWGCDGSSGQSEYKQILPGESDTISDANLFIASLVPIKLINMNSNEVVWQNKTCSSPRYCRPIFMEYSKETPEKTRSVTNDIKAQIQSLQNTKVRRESDIVEIKHELFLTMVDGKVAQVLTDTSSGAVCTICGARPTEMNDLNKVASKPENKDAYQYGLSTLHAWIRCMELILHVSYNLPFQKWSATTAENKRLKEEKKKTVQTQFRNQMGLHIDKPRQGAGNSNDGNTARRFFENYHCSSEITGVDEELIKRLYVILQTLASGHAINPDKFGEYTRNTAQLYVEKYRWYYMPSSVHKILIHGENIIKHFAILPIGQLAEDAQESRNKDYKKNRLEHSRKCSRSATNEDVFHSLLYTSDPYISSLRKPSQSITKELWEEAINLLEF